MSAIKVPQAEVIRWLSDLVAGAEMEHVGRTPAGEVEHVLRTREGGMVKVTVGDEDALRFLSSREP